MRSPFWYGALEALLVPLVFVGLGLAWYGPVAWAAAVAPVYPAGMPPGTSAPAAPPEAEVWLVDGFNVVQVALLGGRDRSDWWGASRRAELLSRAEGLGASEVLVVFDGEREAAAGPGARVRPVFAASADEWLVARVKDASQPEQLVVVTADRRLAGRVRHHGARVVSPGEFLARCGSHDAAPEDWGDSASI